MIKPCCPMLVLCAMLVSGCGDGGAAVLKRRTDLQRLGESYRAFQQQNQRSPAGSIELLEFLSQADDPNEELASAAKALEEGDILMIWNGDLGNPELTQDVDGLANLVLGFEAGVPARGGYVVMANATVKVMKRNEFQSATMIPEQP